MWLVVNVGTIFIIWCSQKKDHGYAIILLKFEWNKHEFKYEKLKNITSGVGETSQATETANNNPFENHQ